MRERQTRDELIMWLKDNGYHVHHTAYAKGYISRKPYGYEIEPYNGRFGKGYVVETPSWKSSRFHEISYWIKELEP